MAGTKPGHDGESTVLYVERTCCGVCEEMATAGIVRVELQHAASADDHSWGRIAMVDQTAPDPPVDAMTARLSQRETLRRAAEDMNAASGIEGVLARISAEITAQAARRHATATDERPRDRDDPV
jgi:hypothetical protein